METKPDPAPVAGDRQDPAAGPLTGVRVVETGQLIAGPFRSQLLGDFGAEVVNIEAPGRGDPMREWVQPDYLMFWEILAHNKRAVSIGPRRPEGQDLTRRLTALADILIENFRPGLIENFRPGALEGWNLSPERLQAGNPRLIIVRVSSSRSAAWLFHAVPAPAAAGPFDRRGHGGTVRPSRGDHSHASARVLHSRKGD